jgi:hypothetical protein
MWLEKLGTAAISNMNPIPDKIRKDFNNLTGGDYQNAMIYAALAGVVVSDLLPTPAMTIARARIKLLQFKQKDGQLSQEDIEKELSKTYAYVLPAWWIAVFSAVHFNKGGFYEKAKIAILMVGAGALVGMIGNKTLK